MQCETKIRSNQERNINAGLQGELLQDPTKVHHIHFLVSLFLSLTLANQFPSNLKDRSLFLKDTTYFTRE